MEATYERAAKPRPKDIKQLVGPGAWERRHPCLLALRTCRQGCLRSQAPGRRQLGVETLHGDRTLVQSALKQNPNDATARNDNRAIAPLRSQVQ